MLVVITAVYKKGPPDDPSNYRPVGLGWLILRILEKWMSLQLTEIINRHGLMSESIHGFMKGKSTETCLEDVRNYAMSRKELGKIVCLILLDATAAFDATPRSLMIGVMKALRCGPITLELLSSYLSKHWMMTVKVDDELSEKFESLEGVIQGGGVSATLYGLTSSIIEFLTRKCGKIFLYADDSCLVIEVDSNENGEMNEKVREAIDLLVEIFQKLGLTINQKKSEILPLWDCIIDHKFIVKDFPCKPSVYIKFLGCQIEKNFSEEEQMGFVVGKINTAYYILKKEGYNRSRRIRVQFYQAYLASHIMYCKNYWLTNTTPEHRRKLQSALDKGLKYAYFGRTYDLGSYDINKIRAKCGIKTVEMIYEEAQIYRALELYKVYEHQSLHSSIYNLEREGYSKERMKINLTKYSHRDNYYRKIWNTFPLFTFVYWSKNKKIALKNYLKKLSTVLLEIEAKIGALSRPPEFGVRGWKMKPMPIMWRFTEYGKISGDLDYRFRKIPGLEYRGKRFCGFQGMDF